MKWPRLILYWFLIIGTFSMTGFLVIISWQFAWSKWEGTPHRLRWYMVTKSNVYKGTKIDNNDLRGSLWWLPQNASFISTAKTAVGKYAVRDIKQGTRLKPRDFSNLAPIGSSLGGAVLPVEVKSEYVFGLKPGMRLAFIQGKIILPSVREPSIRHENTGYLLLSLTLSQREASIATLMVEVPQKHLGSSTALASGQWCPIVLSSYNQK